MIAVELATYAASLVAGAFFGYYIGSTFLAEMKARKATKQHGAKCSHEYQCIGAIVGAYYKTFRYSDGKTQRENIHPLFCRCKKCDRRAVVIDGVFFTSVRSMKPESLALAVNNWIAFGVPPKSMQGEEKIIESYVLDYLRLKVVGREPWNGMVEEPNQTEPSTTEAHDDTARLT